MNQPDLAQHLARGRAECLAWLLETLGDHLFLLRVAPHPSEEADFRFSEQVLADLLGALRARAASQGAAPASDPD
jgi:hypothetical protein